MTTISWLFKFLVVYLWLLMGGPHGIMGSNPFQPILFHNGDSTLRPTTTKSSRGKIAAEKAFQLRANSLSSIEDFANFFNFSLPALPIRRPSISTRIAGAPFIIDTLIENLPQASCIPELTPVPLDLPQDKGHSFFPTCVRVERCGGCCLLSHHSCQPTSIEKIMVKAVKVEEEVTRSRRRRIRDVTPDFITVEVKKHLNCECKCRLQERDCNPTLHFYNENQCACQCADSFREQECFSSSNHFWNSDTCECLCRKTISCSSGMLFDHETCRCVNAYFENNPEDLKSHFDYENLY